MKEKPRKYKIVFFNPTHVLKTLLKQVEELESENQALTTDMRITTGVFSNDENKWDFDASAVQILREKESEYLKCGDNRSALALFNLALELDSAQVLVVNDRDAVELFVIAAEYDFYHVLVYFVSTREIDVSSENASGISALYKACQTGQKRVVKFLLDCGASINSILKHGYTALILAVQYNHVEVVKLLLENEADIEQRDAASFRISKSPIHHAIVSQNVEIVKMLLARGANIFDGENHLATAAEYGAVDIIKVLVGAGIDPNDDKYGPEALRSAQIRHYPYAAEELLKSGANPNILVDGCALYKAIMEDKDFMAELLLLYGAKIDMDRFKIKNYKIKEYIIEKIESDINRILRDKKWTKYNDESPEMLKNAQEEKECKPPSEQVGFSAGLKVIKRLAEDSGDNNEKLILEDLLKKISAQRSSAHHELKMTGNILKDTRLKIDYYKNKVGYWESKNKTLKKLLANARQKKSLIAMHQGKLKTAFECAERALKLDGDIFNDIDFTVPENFQVFMVSGVCSIEQLRDFKGKENVEIVSIWNSPNFKTSLLMLSDIQLKCLEAQFNLLEEREGKLHHKSLLKAACIWGGFEIVKMLVDKGTDVNYPEADGATTLMAAVTSGNYEIVEFILECGGDVKVRANNGVTALMCAALTNKLNIVKLMVKKGGEINAVANSGVTSLMNAASIGSIEIVRFLIKKGAAISIKSKINWSALMWSISADSFSVAKLLIDHGAEFRSMPQNFQSRLLVLAANNNDEVIVRQLVEYGMTTGDFEKDLDSKGKYLIEEEKSKLGGRCVLC